MHGPRFDVVFAIPEGGDPAAIDAFLALATSAVPLLIGEGLRVAVLRLGDVGGPVAGAKALAIDDAIAAGPPALAPGYRVHRRLRAEAPCTIVVPDVGGLGWAVLDARAAALGHHGSVLVSVAVGPSARLRAARGAPGLDFDRAVLDALEADTVRRADAVVPATDAVEAWWRAAGVDAAWFPGPTAGAAGQGGAAAPVAVLVDAVRAGRRGRPGTDPAQPGTRAVPVTAVVTHYERPALARRAVDSLLDQTWPDLRLLVVDDGSRTAAASAFLEELERTPLPRPLTVLRKANGGLGSARNAGLAAAETELVAFLDDDDEAEPAYVETMVQALTATGAAAAAVGFRVFHDVPAGPLEGRSEQLHWLFFSGAVHLAVFDNLMGGAAALFRRADALAVGGFHTERQRSFEDWRLLVELALSGRTVVTVPEPLLRYRVAPQSMLRTFPEQESRQLVRAAYVAALPPALQAWPDLLVGLQAEVDRLGAEVGRLRAELDELRSGARGDGLPPPRALAGGDGAGPATDRRSGPLTAALRRLARRAAAVTATVVRGRPRPGGPRP